MRDLTPQFKNRTIDPHKLMTYGFQKENNGYQYQTVLHDFFLMIVVFTENQQYSKLMDLESEEEYILVDIETSSGGFSTHIRNLYEQKLEEILCSCTSPIIECKQLEEVIHYIENKYQDKIEYLWEKSPSNGIWRNQTNQKWYGVSLKIEEKKLGIPSDQIIDIIGLKYQPEQIEKIIDHQTIFPGYHMNKKHWITIRLDGTLETELLFSLIDNSYELSKKK